MHSRTLDGIGQQLRQVALRDGAGLTDGELLDRFVTRHEQVALAALVRRHGPMVWGVCFRILRNHHDAEDAFQATFLVLFKKVSSVIPKEMVANWLYGVAQTTALKARATIARRRTREKQMTALPEPLLNQPVAWHDVQLALDAELSLLPDKYRAVIVLCDLEGKTRRQVARELGCPEGTIAARVSRGRALLAKRLSRRGVSLSCGLLALFQDASSTCVPSSVLSSTTKAVTLLAARQLACVGIVPIKAAALAERVLRGMRMTKLKAVTTAFLVGAVVGVGAANLVRENGVPSIHATIPVEPPQKPVQTEPKGILLRWSPLGRPLYGLVLNRVIQVELSLTAEQKKSLLIFQAEVVEPLRDMQERNLNWDERDRRYVFAQDKFKRGLPKILDEQQLQRLREIDLQQQSVTSIIFDEDVVRRLKLTTEQQNAIRKSVGMDILRMHRGGKLLDVNNVYKNYKKEMAAERREIIQELVELHAKGHKCLQAGLTEEQNKQLRAMLGKPIEISALLEALDQ